MPTTNFSAGTEPRDFRSISFGISDARSESRRHPTLLIDGYFDTMNVVERALEPGDFLFLGYKGSGKTALSEHLRLTNAQRSDVCITDIQMKSFPYKLFSKIVKGGSEPEAKYPTAWRWILLLYVLHSFDSDTSLNRHAPEEWTATIESLRKCAIFPISTLADIVNKSAKNSFRINFKVVEYTNESGPDTVDSDLNIFIAQIEKILTQIDTPKRHYLIIDGLDDILSSREEQHQSIMALINEARELNDWFCDAGLPFKIVVLCRTDIFDHLSDANKNKIRQDYTFTFKWFDESEADDYKKSNLVQLANLRGRLKYPEIEDVFDFFFPKDFDGKPVCKALLDYTRFTPRDFLQLLRTIQTCCTGPRVTERDINTALKRYSLEYFQGEIHDELAGYATSREIEAIFNVLSTLRRREFTMSDIHTLASENPKFKNIDFNRLFSYLFGCSAIGHLRGNDNKHYYKYRNQYMTFSPADRIILHKGLWKALVI
ncbi:MAG: hypothetical protein NC418_02650 [Muribaculaceae bacterium]|nr:hypothetical protein [Muribaculaceae bacterium]